MSCAVLSPEPFGMLCLLQNNWINNQHLINSKPRLDVCSSIFISTFPKAQRLSCYLSGDFHADFGGPTTWAFRLLHRGCRPPHRDTACSCYLNPRLEKLEVPGPWGHWLSNIIQVGLLHEWWENLQQQHIMPWHNVVWTKEKNSWNGDVCAIWCTWSPTPILHTCLWLLNWCQKDPEIGHVLSTLGSVVTMRLFIGHLNTYTLRIPRIPSSHPPWT